MGAWWSNLFGGDKKPSKHDNAVWELKTQRDKLTMYKKKIEKVIEREITIAQELIRQQKKDKAKMALQKIDQLDFAKIESQVFEGLKAGTRALQQLNNEMKIEDVEKLMEDSREAMEYQDRVSKLLSENLSSDQDAAAMEELEKMEEELLKSQVETVQLPKEKLNVEDKVEENVEEVDEETEKVRVKV